MYIQQISTAQCGEKKKELWYDKNLIRLLLRSKKQQQKITKKA